MRNLQGKLTWVIARPFLLAILLYLPLSATPCHAQCWRGQNPGGVPSMTMTPAAWTAGRSYVVTVSDPNSLEGSFYPMSELQPWQTCVAFVGTPTDNLFNGQPTYGSNWAPDPNVTVSNLSYGGPTEISFTITVGPNGNANNDYWVLSSPYWIVFVTTRVIASATNLGPCNDQCQAQAGAPINVTNGNVWIQQRDYSVPGLGGGLGLVRTWNSQLGNVRYFAGMFGFDWASTYEEYLTGPDSNNYLTYWRGDGSSWSFFYNSVLNSYTLASPPNVRAQLVLNPASGVFTLTLADGTQKVFNAENGLAAIIDRNNNQTTIAYDSSNRITSVASPGGSTLSFTYGDSNNPWQATKVQDSVGTVATYTYDSSERLTLVSYSDGSALNFTYDPNSSMLLSVTDSQGKLIEAHTYDGQYRGLTSTRANGVDSVSLAY